jgi:hypothetical protein
MNVLFLSPHFPPQWWQFPAALKARGHTVLGMADAPESSLHPQVRASLDAYVQVPDLFDREAVLRAAAGLVHRFGRIHRVDSLNEWWLGVEADLREDLNVPGLRPPDILAQRTKSGMAGVFRKAGVPAPETERVTSREAAHAFAGRVGFPLVLKPDVGVGAARTFKVDSPSGLDALVEGLEGYVMQPFVRGQIFTYDGLTTRSGRTVFAISEVYSEGVMEVVNERRDIAFWTLREMPEELEALGKKCVEAFGVRERFFHFEFFRLPDGRFVALEANLRPPGGYCSEMLNYTCDIDVYGLWARVLDGDELEGFSCERRYYVGHAARRFGKRYLRSEADLRSAAGLHAAELIYHRVLPPVFSGAMGDEMFLFRHERLEVLKQAMAVAQELAP